MRLLIVIVNYRTAQLTIDCLRSLAPEVPAEDLTTALRVMTAVARDIRRNAAATREASGG